MSPPPLPQVSALQPRFAELKVNYSFHLTCDGTRPLSSTPIAKTAAEDTANCAIVCPVNTNLEDNRKRKLKHLKTYVKFNLIFNYI